MPLPDVKIRTAKSHSKPYKLFDGGGLFVLVTPHGSKLWRLKYRCLGKERLYSIGPYPEIGLGQAREERGRVKKLLSQGVDPTLHKRNVKHHRMEASQNTLEAVARHWIGIKKIEENHKGRSLRRLELHAFPKLGFRPINEITTAELASCLEAIERKGVLETAHIIKQILQQVFRYAVRRGLITHNPAGDLRDILAHPEVIHRACIPPAELPALLSAIEGYKGDALTLKAIQLLALTFVRTGELIGARWEEIDWVRREWRIPAARMKMRRDHMVPLSRQALSILKELQPLTGKHEYVFHAPANMSGHLSNGAILGALRRMGYARSMTGHGFRALASTILNEQHKYHPDVIERQLAHADRDEVRAAYNRAEHLLERKKMMQEWADYLDAAAVAKNRGKVIVGRFAKTKRHGS